MKERARSTDSSRSSSPRASSLRGSLGIRFASETLGTLYQYLDPAILEFDLGRSLFYLHAQPPLFNLALGLLLKLFPASFALASSLLMSGVAFALLSRWSGSFCASGLRSWIAGAVVLAFALSPNFLVYANWLFYTLPVALMLVAGGVALALYADSGRKLPLAAFAGLAFAVMMTRSTFHPLWLIAVVLALSPFLERRRRRGLTIASFAAAPRREPVVPEESRSSSGSFNGSTWLGLSLSKRWPLSQEEVRELKDSGVIPPYWERRPFQEPKELEVYGFFDGDEPSVHPALDAPYKTNGEPNFNHRDYVGDLGNAPRRKSSPHPPLSASISRANRDRAPPLSPARVPTRCTFS